MVNKQLLTIISGSILISSLVSACSLAPELKEPETELPTKWDMSSPNETSVETKHDDWWTQYRDKQLDELIAQALTYNTDLRLAAERVAEARAIQGEATAQRYPSLDLKASASRTGISPNAPLLSGGGMQPYNDFSLSPVLSFEVDLWGRLANADKAAQERMLAEQANAETVRLAVAAETATNYFMIAALSEQIDITRKTIDNRKAAYNLQEKRLKAGDTDALVLRQAENELMAVQARLPDLEQQRQQKITALAVLLGKTPKEIMDAQTLTSAQDTVLPPIPDLPKREPEDVISGRPDINTAEHNLRAANADIGVARAAYLPRLSLSGLLGVESADLDTLIRSSSKSWNLAGTAAGPLLDFGRARAQVEEAEARKKQAYLNYEQTVRVAFREIMDALTARKKTGECLEALHKQTKVLKESIRLAKRHLDSGYSNYLDVLDAERNLFEIEITQIEVERLRLQSSIDLYKSLGG